MDVLCRDCQRLFKGEGAEPCPDCGSRRTIAHEELTSLTLAHIDCDAFFTSIEQRDNPDLRGRPVIVGGDSNRGVVAACSYETRRFGVHSAMAMVQAKKLCPDAIIVPHRMGAYQTASKQMRQIFLSMTPMVEPASVDEAYLDLSGTEAYHQMPASALLAGATLEIEREIGVTVSVGLSYNKGLAKIASDLDKPRGFSIIGKAEAQAFLANKSPAIISGIGPVLVQKLFDHGITTIGALRQFDELELMKRYGKSGIRLARFARGEDNRKVNTSRAAKSVSAETTFALDIKDPGELARRLWLLCEKVSKRLKAGDQAGQTIVLKLKTANHQSLTRNRKLPEPTQLANTMFEAAQPLLRKEANGRAFRLIGIGVADITSPREADQPSLLDDETASKKADVERAVDKIRAKLGDKIITRASQIK
jgi:DNA polymerase-4